MISSSVLQCAAVSTNRLFNRTPEHVQLSFSLYIFLPPGNDPTNLFSVFPIRTENGNSPGLVNVPPTI